MATLRSEDDTYIIDFGEGENRMTHEFCAQVLELVDEVEQIEGPKALVTTATGKIYSNGLDVEYMAANPEDVARYLGHTMLVCERILTFPAPTAAAINGHAFGLGAFLQLAHDHRVMRSDRGFICWPEVVLGMTFPHPLQELNRVRLPAMTLHEAQVTGRRYGGSDALAAGIVHATVPETEVLSSACELAAPHAATAGDVLGAVKAQLYPDVVALLRDHPNPHS